MAKIGRPKSIKFAKNRVWQIVLTEKLEILARLITQLNGGDKYWTSKFFMECLVEKYLSKDGKINKAEIFKLFQKERIKHMAVERDKIQDNMQKIHDSIKSVREEEQKCKKQKKN